MCYSCKPKHSAADNAHSTVGTDDDPVRPKSSRARTDAAREVHWRIGDQCQYKAEGDNSVTLKHVRADA